MNRFFKFRTILENQRPHLHTSTTNTDEQKSIHVKLSKYIFVNVDVFCFQIPQNCMNRFGHRKAPIFFVIFNDLETTSKQHHLQQAFARDMLTKI